MSILQIFHDFKKSHYLSRSLLQLLTKEAINDGNHNHVQNAWNTFNLKALGDYRDLYVKIDILKLADMFQNF